MSDPLLEQFARCARDYCAWAEASPADPMQEAHTARRLLAWLYATALMLPLPGDSAVLQGRVPDGEYRRMHRRFGMLPVQYYHEVFEPLELEAPSTALGELSDDLADIYADVKRGLEAWERGDAESALHQWHSHFVGHWGKHAVSALRALHQVR